MSQDASSFGVCLVGTGGIASAHAKALSRMSAHRRRWVVSRTQVAADAFRDEWGFDRSGTSLDEALRDDEVDVVIVASPSHLHVEQASRVLQAGKHAIVEIPAALALPDAERLQELAQRSGRRVLCCHTMRSFPAIRELRDRVRGRSIHISQVIGFFAIPRRRNEGWAGTRSWVDNLLWHHACHLVDAALWILGTGTGYRVHASWGRPHPTFGMAMDLTLSFATSAGQLVTHALTYNADKPVWELRFITDAGLLTFRDGSLVDQVGEHAVPPVGVRDVLPQDRAMLAALGSGASCEYDLDEAVPALHLLDLAERSANDQHD